MIRQTIAHFSFKERIVFILSLVIFSIGVFIGIVTLSNHFTQKVPLVGGTYHEGIIGSPRFINPLLATSEADRDLTTLFYSGLVRLGEEGALVPDLAESWNISSDGMTYTFTLKPNLVFHDGKKITSDDVVFTMNSLSNPLIKSPLRVAWEGVSVTNPDEKTVVITLKKPYSGFLSQANLGILPQHIWKDIPYEGWSLSKYNTEPIGSGPYKLNRVHRNKIGTPESYELDSFKKFVLGKPFIKTIRITFFANTNDASTAFKNDRIDGISGIHAQAVDQITDTSTTIVTQSLPRVFGIFFNATNNKIFSDPNVVRALNLIIDKPTLTTTLFDGYAHPLSGPLPTSTIALSPDDYATQKALGIKLLENAGWKINPETGFREKGTGKDRTMLTFSLATTSNPELEQSARLIADMYKELGISIEIKIFEVGTLNENIIRKRDFEALLFGQVIRHDTDIYAFWHSSQRTDPGLNITGYVNKNVDNLLELAIKETSPDKRSELYTSVSRELAKDAPVAFLYTPDFIYLVNNHVENPIIPSIADTDDRFSLIYKWYIHTDRIWNIFLNN